MTLNLPRAMQLILLSILASLIAQAPGAPALTEALAAAAAAGQSPETVAPWTAPDQEAAASRALEIVPFVAEVMDECLLCRQQRLRDAGLGVKDQEHSYFLLDSPILKKLEDRYEPVRFMHAKHASQIQDCALCHHYRPLDESASETVRCSACHQEPFNADHPERLGLKAAYHQQCTDCHTEDEPGDRWTASGCHHQETYPTTSDQGQTGRKSRNLLR
jgi:hypothetical protein